MAAPLFTRPSRARIPRGRMVHLVLGPWNHGQGRREGRGIGEIQFEGDTATWFRRTVMQPFLDHYLKDAPMPDIPRALVYETGADQWHRYDAWPRSCAEGARSARATSFSSRRPARASSSSSASNIGIR